MTICFQNNVSDEIGDKDALYTADQLNDELDDLDEEDDEGGNNPDDYDKC